MRWRKHRAIDTVPRRHGTGGLGDMLKSSSQDAEGSAGGCCFAAQLGQQSIHAFHVQLQQLAAIRRRAIELHERA